jgi:O-antigen/teichoic acid export membrane protein
MMVVPGDLLALVFGEPFRDAAPILFLLSAAHLANVFSGQCGTALTMSHQEGAVAAVQSVSVALRVVLGSAAAVLVGVLALAVVSSAVSVGVYLTMWWLARRRLGLRTDPTLRPQLGLLRRTEG